MYITFVFADFGNDYCLRLFLFTYTPTGEYFVKILKQANFLNKHSIAQVL